MREFLDVTARVVPAFLLAIAGGAVGALFAVSHQRLCRMISFAAGTLMGVTLFTIVPECFETLEIWKLLIALGSGYLLFFLVSRYVFHVCPACAASHFDEATTHRFGEIAGVMILALGLHSTMDGLALALGKESGALSGLDASMFLAICVHKVPEGLALCALLMAAGFRRGQALVWVAAVESTTLLGGGVGLWVAPKINKLWLDSLMAHIGGGFIFLAIHAVFGELFQHSKKQVLFFFCFGILLIGFISFILPHH
ncbi:MAG: ZIP family metal transporter [Acidobacteriota bacterium]